MKDYFVRTPFNYDMELASEVSGLECLDASRTIQSQEAEANINNIVRDFGITGQLPQVVMPPTYEDFSDVFDYRSALELVKQAQDRFNEMTSETRERFQNSPALFLDFVQDPANIPEMRKMGLMVPEVKQEIPPA